MCVGGGGGYNSIKIIERIETSGIEMIQLVLFKTGVIVGTVDSMKVEKVSIVIG